MRSGGPNNRGNRRGPPESNSAGAAPRDRDDRDFRRELEMRLQVFLTAEDEELELEPMNSYRRHLAHSIAQEYHLKSESRGEDRERRVCLIKTPQTQAPQSSARTRAWDFGTQTFAVNAGSEGLRIALLLDGSVEILAEGNRRPVLDERVVTSREIRVRRGRIVEPGDPNW